MTDRDIMKQALEAGIKNDCDGIWCDGDQLIAFAALVAAAEREACAKLCEEPGWNAANWCAKQIRARGQG